MDRDDPFHQAEIDGNAPIGSIDMPGTWCAAQSLTISDTSAVVRGYTTMSGGWFFTQVRECPCCSRTAAEVATRSPKCPDSSDRREAMEASVAFWRTGTWDAFMEASDPVAMLELPIATRTATKAKLRMRKMPHPSCTPGRNVLTFVSRQQAVIF
jgi:hypothetical protein